MQQMYCFNCFIKIVTDDDWKEKNESKRRFFRYFDYFFRRLRVCMFRPSKFSQADPKFAADQFRRIFFSGSLRSRSASIKN
jgi:hypothetical protein